MHKNPEIEAKLVALERAQIAELRRLWGEQSHVDTVVADNRAFGPDLLKRSIAQKLQTEAYGGLSSVTARLLSVLVRQCEKTNGAAALPRRIAPGAVLTRGWKGKRYRVMVLEDGFAFDGKPYDSLSEIARLITGTRWNGPRFFGLRAAETDRRGE